MRLTSDGWIVTGWGSVVLIVGVVLRHQPLVIVGVGLVASVLVAASAQLVFRRRPHWEVHRSVHPRRAVEGGRASTTLTITNRSSRRARPLRLRDQSGSGTATTGSIPPLDAGASTTITIALSAAGRGHHRLGPVSLSVVDPLGLVCVPQYEGASATWVVHPLVHTTSLPSGGASTGLEDETARTGERGGVAFHSLREYVAGDDLRLIHWRSSARTGTLTVRQEAAVERRGVLVVLDSDAASYDDPGHFDEAVRLAASLAVAGLEGGHRTEVATTAVVEGARWSTGEPLARTQVLDLLAAAAMTDDGGGLLEVARTRCRHPAGLAAIVTGHPSPSRLAGLAAARASVAGAVTLLPVGLGPNESLDPVPGVRIQPCRRDEQSVRRAAVGAP